MTTSDTDEHGLTISETAHRTGVGVHTLRYYERAGLLATTIGRTPAGRRRYRTADLEWIRVCSKLRATGMPLRLIRRYAALVRAGAGNEPERLGLLESHRRQVLADLAELRTNLELIDHKIQVYRDRVAAGDAHLLWSVPRAPDVPETAEPS